MKGEFLMDNILLQLEQIRENMIRSGMEHGFRAPKTIHLSKELDRILNLYNKIYNTTLITKK